MARKYRNTESFKVEIENMYGENISVIGEFVNMKTKVKMKCLIHNEYFEKEPDKILNRNQHCQRCGRERISRARSKSHEEFEREFFAHRSKEEYKILSEYLGDRKEIRVKHILCNSEYVTTPVSISASSIEGCPICNDKRKTINKYRSEVYDLVGKQYIVLGRYSNCYTHIEMKHIKCGETWMVMPNAFLQGSRCPSCNIVSQRKTHHDFAKQFSDLVGKEYTMIGEYTTSKNKIKIKHLVCGNEWNVSPSHFLNGTRCPKCYQASVSKGEEYVSKYLLGNAIKHTSQKSFKKCVYKKKLPFDFYIGDSFLIEYDGGHHFYSVEYFGGKENFDTVAKKDIIKNKYCIDNNIPLLRIPYWEFDNIEVILESVLMHFNIIERSDTCDINRIEEYLVDEYWSHDEYIAKCPKNQKDKDNIDKVN